MPEASEETKRRVKAIELGIRPSRVDMRAGLISALAGEPGYRLDQWLAATFNHNFDAYDRAIDAVYNATHVGGSQLHHLVDGQHSLLGALAAVKDVAADDGFARELAQASEHLLRDTASVSGTNVLYSIEPDTFQKVAGVAAHAGVSKSYLADAMTVNGSELLGGAIGLAAAIVVARRGQPEDLSRLSGAMLASSFASANPALLGVAGASMAYALYKGEGKRACLVQAGRGAVVSGSVILVTNVLGGPVWWGCLAGMGTAVLVGKALDDPAKTYARIKALIKPAQYIIKTAYKAMRMEDEHVTT
jgi:hypothetical protein